MSFCWARTAVYSLLGIMLFSILVAGCAGMKPYEPRNNREEGPESGLFSGQQGEFVILRKAEPDKKDQSEEKADPHDE